MESRLQRIFLSACVLVMSIASTVGGAGTDPDELELEPLLVREPDRRQVEIDDLDNENFEIGGYGGLISFQDFGIRIHQHSAKSYLFPRHLLRNQTAGYDGAVVIFLCPTR